VTATGSDAPPVAALAVNPSTTPSLLEITADASASTDTDSTPISTYTFDFGDGSAAVGPQAGATVTHSYANAGTYTVTVTVKDTAGLSSTATATVVVKKNLITNSGFETDTSGWNTGGSASTLVTLARVSGGHTGGWSVKLSNNDTVNATCQLNDSPNWVASTVAGTYTASAWVRADTPGAIVKLRLKEYVNGTLVGSKEVQLTLTTAWQQISLTYSPVSPGSSTLDYTVRVSEAVPGLCFYADDTAEYVN
jgi:PKD repeat protein